MEKHRVTREDAVRYLVLRIRSLVLLLFGGRHDSASDAAEKSPKPRCVSASVRYRAASLSFHRSASERVIDLKELWFWSNITEGWRAAGASSARTDAALEGREDDARSRHHRLNDRQTPEQHRTAQIYRISPESHPALRTNASCSEYLLIISASEVTINGTWQTRLHKLSRSCLTRLWFSDIWRFWKWCIKATFTLQLSSPDVYYNQMPKTNRLCQDILNLNSCVHTN